MDERAKHGRHGPRNGFASSRSNQPEANSEGGPARVIRRREIPAYTNLVTIRPASSRCLHMLIYCQKYRIVPHRIPWRLIYWTRLDHAYIRGVIRNDDRHPTMGIGGNCHCYLIFNSPQNELSFSKGQFPGGLGEMLSQVIAVIHSFVQHVTNLRTPD